MGSIVYPLTAQLRDDIECHGLRWTIRNALESRRIPMRELRVLIASAYL